MFPCLRVCAGMDPCYEQLLAGSRSLSLCLDLGQITWPELWDGIVEMMLGDPNADPDDLKVPTPHLHETIVHAFKPD